MKKRFTLIGLLSIFILAFAGCGSDAAQVVYQEIGLKVSEESQVLDYDTHDGEGSDGVSCSTFSFKNDKVLKEIKADSDWKEFPLDETAMAIAYGNEETEAYLVMPDGKNIIPEVTEGYYLFIDRHENAGDGAEVLDREEVHVTLAIYNTENDTLYYCKVDKTK